MREIEFRGKTYGGVWFYGYYLINRNRSGNDYDTIYHPDTDIFIMVIPETVGQLFLNNPEICKSKLFEHDIVRIKLPDSPFDEGRTFIGVIEFDTCDGRFKVNEWRNGESDWDFHYIHIDMEVEKLGNIFDNPELRGEL